MKLASYLSPSRHGVYYFRWPLPVVDKCKRQTVKVSLRTKCPDRAGELARYMAACGILIRDNKTLRKLRQDEIRTMVRDYFVKALEGYTERLNDTGWDERELGRLREELSIHEDGIAGFDDLSDQYLDIQTVSKFRSVNKISDAEWAQSEADLRRELRKGRKNQLEAFLSRAEGLEGYELTSPPSDTAKAPQGHTVTLVDAFDDFVAENAAWSKKMLEKAQGFMAIPIEYFGSDRVLSTITRQDANELKKILQRLPLHRNTRPQTKGLPLLEAIEVTGVDKVSLQTVKNHISMFIRFWDWAESHDLTPHKLFAGMQIKSGKQKALKRKAFSKGQLATIIAELADDESKLVKTEDRKWGGLIGLCTGARVNEIAQQEAGDIIKEDGIWFFNITDDGDNKKRLKAAASKRKVPIHSELLKLGLLDFVATKESEPRLFMSFTYTESDGFGRNLGRWFNTALLTGLGIKEPNLSYHSLRHTAVTSLRQAGIELALVQDIVGHERNPVNDGYFGDGYTLAQKQNALEKLEF